MASSSLPRIVVVGGSGKVALHFARLAASHFSLTSLVRSSDRFDAIEATGATPKLLSLEDASVKELAKVFEGAQGVLFSAGAGGKGGKERTKKVDEEGAIKVFDAIETLPDPKPKLILVSALDTRDLSKPPPSYYTAEDIKESKKAHEAIGAYYDAKLAADRSLHKRTSFPWIVLRPGHLRDEPAEGTGKVQLGRTGMGSVTRADVARTLLSLFRLPRAAGNGLALDLIQNVDSEVEVEKAVKEAVERGVSDWHD
ncbi:hypothetical protein JCM10213_001827 [Rhodosporidiobolus nylandii]